MTETIEKTIELVDIEPPKNWNVIYHNDDQTPFSFVVLSLVNIFGYEIDDAISLTNKIQDDGRGVVGNFPKPIAEEKVNEVMEMNHLCGMNLEATVEEEQ